MISFAEQPGGARKRKVAPVTFDSANHFEVVGSPTGVILKKPPLPHQVVDKEQAVGLAAWLVALSGANADDFVRMLAEIAKK